MTPRLVEITPFVLLAALILNACAGQPSTSTPTPFPTNTPYPTPVLEVVENTEVSGIDKLGEVNIEYPIRMSPRSSDSVRVSIYIPPQLASLEPVAIERIEIPPDAPRIVGELNSHTAIILVAKEMRVELSSPTFEIENLYPSKQSIDLASSNKLTIWAWTIVAPDTIGNHVLTMRVYPGDGEAPSWVGNIKVEVTQLGEPLPLATLIIVTAIIIVVVIGSARFLTVKGRLPISPNNRKDYLQRQIIKSERRLQGLKEKKASLGFSADPSLDIEIEEIEAEIEELQAELSQLGNTENIQR